MPDRAYADVVGNFRRGEAGAYARDGNYEGAARALAVDDPAMSESYRQRGREEDQAAYQRNYAGSYASGDYEGAAVAAAKAGDLGGVSTAREAQTQHTQQERVEAYRALLPYRNELRQIGQAGENERPALYQGWAQRVRSAAEQSGDQNLVGWVRQNVPVDAYNPRVQGALESQVDALMAQILSPNEIATIERENARAERGRRRDMTPDEIAARGLRPGTVAQIDGDGQVYVVQQPRERPEEGDADFRGERDLRREFAGLQGQFRNVRDSYATINTLVSGEPSAAGDISLIFAYMKMLDPTSVVREGEQANAQNAAGVPQQIANTYNRLISGQRLNPPQRQDFGGQARALYETRRRQYERDAAEYRRLAGDYGYDASRVVLDDQTLPEPGAGDPAAPTRLPPANQRRAGERYQMPDGGTAEWNGSRFINPQRPGG